MDEFGSEAREEIAIVGMACRLPGARNVDEFWRNLRGGVESIRRLSREELLAAGVDEAELSRSNFVPFAATLDDAELFDASFFGYMPREAEIIDPQQRVFLECCWSALENGGYDPQGYSGNIGVFGGVARNTYLVHNVLAHPEHANTTGLSPLWLGNDKDFVATRVSHKLNLKGPAFTVQTACSTSGVAIHLACQSLLAGESDMALAGGARIQVPLNAGYLHTDGGILSRDGHCRAFDKDASGTIVGSGAGVVLLKRLSDALRDGDHIYAVIKAAAINNDGSAKAGFTAPSVSGQAGVVAEAHALAEIDPETIGYIETHGTATAIGDPIEIAALTQAFRKRTQKKSFCAIGSVKSNIGHLDAGAGAAGVIKAALSLKHRTLVPSLHYERPNPQIDFASSPFYVNKECREWSERHGGVPPPSAVGNDGAQEERRVGVSSASAVGNAGSVKSEGPSGSSLRTGSSPTADGTETVPRQFVRRAAVSSFGLGGTNAHIILEEAPEQPPSESSRAYHTLLLSARTPSALDAAAKNLAAYLKEHASLPLADVAYTLQAGRRAMEHRRAVICNSVEHASKLLEQPDTRVSFNANVPSTPRSVAFMFPGGGAQYPGMGAGLYEAEPAYREALDECLSTLKAEQQLDLRGYFDGSADPVKAALDLERPSLGLPALFISEYAIARMWMAWGVRPAAMIGHSMGEYTAACLAGVISLSDALALVSLRGRLFEKVPAGAMLSVPLSEKDAAKYAIGGLSIAAVNAPEQCVLAGPLETIAAAEATLKADGVDYVRVRIAVAAHSATLDPILPEFAEFLKKVRLREPSIPYVSNVTGDWITPEQACDPQYFVRHLRSTVRFAQGLKTLTSRTELLPLECGPGRMLSSLAGQSLEKSIALTSLRHPKDTVHDGQHLAATIGRLWVHGVNVDWSAYHRHERRLRVPLPGYPFERKRCWIDPPKRRAASSAVGEARGTERRVSVPPTSEVGMARGAQAGDRELFSSSYTEHNPTAEAGETPTLRTQTKEPAMKQESTPARTAQIETRIKEVLSELSGIPAADLQNEATFFELGFDSLFLTRATQTFEREFGVKITFRQLLEQLPSVSTLAKHLDETLPPEAFREADVSENGSAQTPHPAFAAAPLTSALSPEGRGDAFSANGAPRESTTANMAAQQFESAVGAAAGVFSESAADNGWRDARNSSSLEQIVQQQLQLMSQQLQLLRGGAAVADGGVENGSGGARVPMSANGGLSTSVRVGKASNHRAAAAPGSPSNGNGSGTVASVLHRAPHPALAAAPLTSALSPEGRGNGAHGPYMPLNKGSDAELTRTQKSYLDELIARYTRRTATSKRLAQENRQRLADPRAISGFRALWKEMVYPIVASKTAGSKMWDVDGNEYIDLIMGYGISLFGNSPPFIVSAIEEQIKAGFAIGPSWELAGRVAELFCELTGAERITFCNTGSEAVMAALRVARTVSGRPKIAFFADSYHGVFDEVLVRSAGPKGRPVPVAPGIPAHAGQDVIILPYGNPAALETIRAHADDIAAVVVEPVQSKHPDLQPREFLQQLRALTHEKGIALIFDEMITGFRIHPGGAQAHFGVKADLAAYGKVAGGGMPIGVLAGRSCYMDALDGGAWRYGDASAPEATITYFAGTFVRHPFALAAAHAALTHLKRNGPALQENLNTRAARLVNELNSHFDSRENGLQALHFGSVFKLVVPLELPLANLIFFALREKGIDTWERRNCFLSTAHSDEDIEKIIEAYKSAADELQDAGFLRSPGGSSGGLELVGFDSASGNEKKKSDALSRRGGVSPPRRHAGETPALRKAPLTQGQREIWLACQMSPEASCAYNESTTLRIRGALEIQRLASALHEIGRRHEALRTTFASDGQEQVIAAEPSFSLSVRDVSHAGESVRSVEINELLGAEPRTPFDLERGPLWRGTLFRLAPTEHLLVLSFHHLIVDGWSIGTLLYELGELYRGGTSAKLKAPLSIREFEASRHIDPAHENWWIEKLTPPPSPLELPLDAPRPAFKTFAAAVERFTLSGDICARLKTFSGKRRATLFTALLTTYQVLLHRLTGQDDIVVGIPAAGQAKVPEHSLIGHCVNMLPIRSRLDDKASFDEVLERTRTFMLDAFERQEVTFSGLLPRLKLQRDFSRTPLIEAAFNFERAERLELPGLDVDVHPLPKQYFNFDLFLNVRQQADQLELVCCYNRDLLHAETIRRWLAHFQTLLNAVLENSAREAARLPLMAREWRVAMDAINATQVPLPEGTVLDLFEARVRECPEASVTDGVRRLTYGELNALSNHLAARLRESGVRAGTAVASCFGRSIEQVAACVAIAKAGGVYIPLDPDYPPARLQFMLEDAKPLLVLSNAELKDKLKGACPVCELDLRALQSQPAPISSIRPGPEDPAYIIYTSGSTGKPKGVRIRHRSLLNLIRWHLRRFSPTAQDRASLLAGPAFDASMWEIWSNLCGGVSIVIPGDAERHCPEALAHWLSQQKVAMSFLPTPLAEGLMALPQARELKTLRFFFVGGDNLRSRPQRGSPFRVFNLYGPTECTVISTASEISAEPRHSPPDIGHPIDNTIVYVLDRNLQPVPMGVVGELYIGGAGLAEGYVNRPELNRERFVDNPFTSERSAKLYRTGDRVRMLPGGKLICVGRVDEQVKLRGYRVECGEIEAALREHEAVREALVVPRNASAQSPSPTRGALTPNPSPTRGEGGGGATMLCAYYTTGDGVTPSDRELREHLKKRLPEYMIPAVFMRLQSFPLTPNGKVDKAALPAPDDAPVLVSTPMTELESRVAAVWCEVLKRERIGQHDHFFALGGHSLLAAQIASRLSRQFNVTLTLRSVFEAPTVAELANLIDASRAMSPVEGHAIERIPRGGDLPLSFAQQRLWFMDQLDPQSATFIVPCALRLSGELNAGALERAVNEIIRRHEILRARFISQDGQPALRIAPPEVLRLVSERVASEKEARAIATDEARRPFDLANGPLFRIRLLSLAPLENILLFNVHHIVFDGWSLGVFVRELATLYAAYAEGGGLLPELPIQYVDVAAWQRRVLSGAFLERQLNYWRLRLKPAPAPLNLGQASGVRPESFRGARHEIRIEAEIVERLRAIGRQENASLYMVVLAAYKLLLERFSGQEDIAVGTPVAGRNRPEMEGLIGFFINTVVLRTDLAGIGRFHELLRRVRATVLGALANQDVPFERVVQELQPERKLARAPFFNVFFNMLTETDGEVQPQLSAGLKIEPVVLCEHTESKFDLSLKAVELDAGRGGLELTAIYNAALLDESFIASAMSQLRTLLHTIAQSPDRPLAALSNAASDELSAFNQAFVE
ncbi:MAG TPA: amino acid adenylation domain-containing protein [Planctomycetota bacterium]|nr:amino acid adenylation domain-containing protein [Planctomycetota bacterium]